MLKTKYLLKENLLYKINNKVNNNKNSDNKSDNI